MSDSIAKFQRIASPIIKQRNVNSVEWDRAFRAHFGVSVDVCAECWFAVRPRVPDSGRPIHLLYMLYHLKTYESELVACPKFNCTAKTYRKWVRIFIDLVRNIGRVDFEDRFGDGEETDPSVSIDGVDIFIDEHRPLDKRYYSHKFHHAGLLYLIALSLAEPAKIVWWGGGVPCGRHPDIVIARSEFVSLLPDGEHALADLGFRGESSLQVPYSRPCTTDERKYNKQHKLYMARHETINKRIKQWRILREWRHRSDTRHNDVFGAIIELTNLMLAREPLFKIKL